MSVDTESARIFAQLIEAMVAGPGVDEPTARDAARVLRELASSVDHGRSEMARLAGALELALTNTERDLREAREDRGSAEATIARLQAEVARLTAREAQLDQLDIVRERNEARAALENYYRPYVDAIRRAYGCGELDPDPDPARIAALRAQVERLQNDVVELTQAGDLHRKEGDEARAQLAAVAALLPPPGDLFTEEWVALRVQAELDHLRGLVAQAGVELARVQGERDEARAHLREVFLLARAGTTRDEARIDEARAYLVRVYLEAVDREGPRAPGVLAEVKAERDRQDAKWGERNHPDQVGGYLRRPIELAGDFRRWLRDGSAAWDLILLEEVAEAWDAIGNEKALRAELVQVAAVAVAWVEALDRRQATP